MFSVQNSQHILTQNIFTTLERLEAFWIVGTYHLVFKIYLNQNCLVWGRFPDLDSASDLVATVLFQHDFIPEHKAWTVKKWFSQFGVEELDWPAQSPDLNPRPTPLGWTGTLTVS